MGSPQASNRGGFMRRAFTRQQGSGGTLSAAQQAQHGSPAAVEGPAGLFQQRVREFNACVPLSGVSPGVCVGVQAGPGAWAWLPPSDVYGSKPNCRWVCLGRQLSSGRVLNPHGVDCRKLRQVLDKRLVE